MGVNVAVESSLEQIPVFDIVDSVVEQYGQKPSSLIAILQDTQERVGYLPENVLRRVADDMELPLRQVYSVATFYKSLNLSPQGRHTITVCLGTACHVRGSGKIMNELSSFLEVESGETTEDGEFTLKAVNCLGACAIGPVIMIDEEYYGGMSASRAKDLLVKFRS